MDTKYHLPPPPPQRPLDSSGAGVVENGLQAAKKDNTFNIDNDSHPAPSAADQWLQNGFPKGLPTPPMPKPYLYDDSNVDQNRQSDCHQKPYFRTFSENSAHSLDHHRTTAVSLNREQPSLWSCGSTNAGNMVASPLARLLWPAGVLPDTQVQTLNNTKAVKSSPESFTLSPGLKLHSVAEEMPTQVVDPRIEATSNQVIKQSLCVLLVCALMSNHHYWISHSCGRTVKSVGLLRYILIGWGGLQIVSFLGCPGGQLQVFWLLKALVHWP